MATNYRFETTSYSVVEVSDLFCAVLELGRLRPSSATPIVSEAWWAGVTSDSSREFAASGRRLGASGSYTSIAFVPSKRMSWEDEVRGLVRIIKTVVDLLARDPDSSGFLEFYDEIVVLEKRKGQGIVVDPRLLDPDDLDDLQMFAPILSACTVGRIDQF